MKYISKLGLPYMGSKRKLAKPIIDYILKHNPNTTTIYDIFGGGGAMSFEAIQRPQIKQVFYNDFNKGIVELLKKIRDDGVTKEFYKWVDRDTFKKHKDDESWYGGLLATCWSFGSNGKGYLFGKEIEEGKRLLHEIVVDECVESLELFNNKYKCNITMNDGLIKENITQRRMRIAWNIRDTASDKSLIKSVVNIDAGGARNLSQHLERLEYLERLEQLQQLQLTNHSYENVKITTPPNETIIYLDPPYKDVAKYAKGICHKELYKWVDTLTERGYKVYISSYKSHLPCVLELEHRSSLSATANNKVTEKLYGNTADEAIEKKEITQGSLF